MKKMWFVMNPYAGTRRGAKELSEILAVFADSGVAMLCVLNSVRMLYKK